MNVPGPPAVGPVPGAEDVYTALTVDAKRTETKAELRALGSGRRRDRIILLAIAAVVLSWLGWTAYGAATDESGGPPPTPHIQPF